MNIGIGVQIGSNNYVGEWVPVERNRLTEDGDTRVTEDGDTRVWE